MRVATGWWVDWDGRVRKSEALGIDYRAYLNDRGFLDICLKDGEVIFEATYYPCFDCLEKHLHELGCVVDFA